MDERPKRLTVTCGLALILSLLFLAAQAPLLAKGKKKPHPYDVYDHEMHMGLFEAAEVACETCHADPASYGDRTKVNRLGCHLCHNSPKPILPANKPCTVCHVDGPPKPETHRAGWKERHQATAKADPAYCTQCHTNPQFCIDCHKRRDTIREAGHRRNFRLFHSIEARANPRKCDACHTVGFCQQCHSGQGSSLK